MSNSLTADEKKYLLTLLRKVDDPDSFHHLLGDVGTQAALQFQMAAEGLASEMSEEDLAFNMGFEPVASLSMTDACKRRLTADVGDAGYGAMAKQMPRPPCQAALEIREAQIAASERLASDVVDIQDWGTTIMLVGKYGDLGKSYFELASDRSSDVVKYCKWLEGALSEKMKPQFHDFVKYLQTARELIPDIFNPASSSAGPGFVRQRKTTWETDFFSTDGENVISLMCDSG